MKKHNGKLRLALLLLGAGIVVGGVGFSSWIIGAQITDDDLSVTLSVDDTKSQFVKIEASWNDSEDGKLVIAEPATQESEETSSSSSTNYVTSDGNPNAKMDVDIKFTITTAKDLNVSNYSVSISLDETSSAIFKAKDNSTTFHTKDVDSSPETYGTYVDFTSVTIEDTDFGEESTEGNLDTYTFTKKVSFNWGSYFDSKAPSAFYNEKLASLDQTSAFDKLDAITSEMNAMKTALNNQTVKLNIKLNGVNNA